MKLKIVLKQVPQEKYLKVFLYSTRPWRRMSRTVMSTQPANRPDWANNITLDDAIQNWTSPPLEQRLNRASGNIIPPVCLVSRVTTLGTEFDHNNPNTTITETQTHNTNTPISTNSAMADPMATSNNNTNTLIPSSSASSIYQDTGRYLSNLTLFI